MKSIAAVKLMELYVFRLFKYSVDDWVIPYKVVKLPGSIKMIGAISSAQGGLGLDTSDVKNLKPAKSMPPSKAARKLIRYAFEALEE